jgi:alpha-L-fucosidase 2
MENQPAMHDVHSHRSNRFLRLAFWRALPRWQRRDSTPAGQPLPVPERGFVSAEPAETWEQGLITGNGTIGANVLSRPLDETIVFTHERMFLPQGEPVVPPDTAARLPDVRALIDQGKYQEATQLAFDLSGQDGFMYPDPFVPAFDLRIQTEAEGEVTDYLRSVDFQTGEATVHWADDRGAFERRLFVSRADGVAVLQITGPERGSVDCRMQMVASPAQPQVEPENGGAVGRPLRRADHRIGNDRR